MHGGGFVEDLGATKGPKVLADPMLLTLTLTLTLTLNQVNPSDKRSLTLTLTPHPHPHPNLNQVAAPDHPARTARGGAARDAPRP